MLIYAGAKSLEQMVPYHAPILSELTRCFSTAEKKSLIRLLSKLRRELRRRHGEHPS